MKHVFQVGFRILPGGDSIAKENEVIDNTPWIGADHLTHASKGGIFFVVVTYITKAGTPGTHKLAQGGRHFLRTDKAHSAQSNGRVLQQRLGRVGSIDDQDQGLEKTKVLTKIASFEIMNTQSKPFITVL